MLNKPTSRRNFLQTSSAGLLGLASFQSIAKRCHAASQTPPNVLWILGDDLGVELGCYGEPGIKTPHLDRLASEGVRFTHCYTTAPVCSASRSALITGMYQTSIGAHNHRSHRDKPLPAEIPFLPDLFRQAGYYTANSNFDGSAPGKTDFNFLKEQPFDGIDWSDRKPGQPFYAQVNFFEPHRPFKENPDHPIDPEKVRIPKCYPEHPLTRRDWAGYLSAIEVLDDRVGQLLERLEREGLAENTIVFFFGDNGRCHVRDKQFLYEGGIHVPLLVRWRGFLEAGMIREDLVSGIDLAVTSLKMAGIEVPERMQGQTFLGGEGKKREMIFAARDRCDETVDRIRCVRTYQYKYIRNFYPDRPYTQMNRYKEHSYQVLKLMRELQEKGELTKEQSLFLATKRPAEELYDLHQDPDEFKNLADSKDHGEVLAEMRGMLEQWMEDSGDQGRIPEPPDIVANWEKEMMQAYEK